MKILMLAAVLLLIAGCIPLTDENGNPLRLKEVSLDGGKFALAAEIIQKQDTGWLKAQVKGSIYETGEQMSVFGTCLNVSDQPVIQGTYATFSSWYPNGTMFFGNVSLLEIQPGYFLYTGAMAAVQGTYLTEITCHVNGSSATAKAWGEWQNPFWVKRVALLNDSLANLTQDVLSMNQSLTNTSLTILEAVSNISVNVNVFNSTIFYPTSAQTLCGVDAGGNDIGNLSYPDGQSYTVTESAGACAFEVRVNFTNVTSFNQIELYSEYLGTHSVEVDLWDYNASIWEQYLVYTPGTGFVYRQIPVVDGGAHNQSGLVQVRLVHVGNGQNGQTHAIDWLALENFNGLNFFVNNEPVLAAIASMNNSMAGNFTVVLSNLTSISQQINQTFISLSNQIVNQSYFDVQFNTTYSWFTNITNQLNNQENLTISGLQNISNQYAVIASYLANLTNSMQSLSSQVGNISVQIGNISLNMTNMFLQTWQYQNQTNALINYTFQNLSQQLIYVASVANASVDRNDSYLANLIRSISGIPVTRYINKTEYPCIPVYKKNCQIDVTVRNEYNVTVGYPLLSCFINITQGGTPTETNELMNVGASGGNPHDVNTAPWFTWTEKVISVGDFNWTTWCIYN